MYGNLSFFGDIEPRHGTLMRDFACILIWQESGVSSFLEGFSLVVCAPTSSGKTLIAEAAAAAILARGKRLLYTTPLKALSNQKLREFQ